MKLRKTISGVLAAAVIVSAIPQAAAEGTETEKLMTPAQAVAEMTWGVNLADLYIADPNPDRGYTESYCKFAPVGMAIWYGNEDFEWLAEYGPHTKVSVVSPVPDYNKQAWDDGWVDGLFTIGIMLNDQGFTVKLSLSGSRIVLSDGSSISLDFMDKTYEFSDFDENGWHVSLLNDSDASRLPQPGEYLNGSRFETTIEVLDVTLPEGKTKAEYYVELNRYKIDQFELADIFLDQGVNVIRLPVTWAWFIDDETFEIDEDWLAAVKTEVDYIIGRGAYCILDMHNDYMHNAFVGDHWDNLWMYDEYKEYVDKRFVKVWEQIAEYFKDYSQKLIFEPCNEPTMSWYEGDPDDIWDIQAERVNELNAMFVDTVRKTGGNNTTRFLNLAVANYCDEWSMQYLELPQDDYLIVGLHSYDEMENTWIGYEIDYKAETDEMFELIDEFVKETGVPVIIAEAGVNHMQSDEYQAERVEYFFQKAKEYGVPGLWWEDYFVLDTAYWLYDKENDTWRYPLLKAIQNAAGNAVKIAATAHGTVTADRIAAAAGDTVRLTVTADERYALDTLTVTDGEGNELVIADNAFIMPASAVTVTAVFEPTFIVGNVNGDEKVNDLDVAALARFVAGWGISIDEAAADVDGNGKVNDADVVMLARRVAGWSV